MSFSVTPVSDVAFVICDLSVNEEPHLPGVMSAQAEGARPVGRTAVVWTTTPLQHNLFIRKVAAQFQCCA